MPFYEPQEKLTPETLDLERARKSLREELEAIDYYQERIEAATDESLKIILTHNMNEEKEHVAMLMEWIQEHDPVQNQAFQNHD
ncbi:MAG: ferritin [bacterium]